MNREVAANSGNFRGAMSSSRNRTAMVTVQNFRLGGKSKAGKWQAAERFCYNESYDTPG
jgi:hypothetical protein